MCSTGLSLIRWRYLRFCDDCTPSFPVSRHFGCIRHVQLRIVHTFKSWNQVIAGLLLRCLTVSVFCQCCFVARRGRRTFLSAILFLKIKTDPILSNTHLFISLSIHDTLSRAGLNLSDAWGTDRVGAPC